MKRRKMVLPRLGDVDALPYLEIAGLRYNFFYIFKWFFSLYILSHFRKLHFFIVCLFAELFKIWVAWVMCNNLKRLWRGQTEKSDKVDATCWIITFKSSSTLAQHSTSFGKFAKYIFIHPKSFLRLSSGRHLQKHHSCTRCLEKNHHSRIFGLFKSFKLEIRLVWFYHSNIIPLRGNYI